MKDYSEIEINKRLEEELLKLKSAVGKIEESNEIAKSSSIRLDEISEEYEQLNNTINTTKNEVNLLKKNQSNDISGQISERIADILEKYELLKTLVYSSNVELNQLIENQRNVASQESLTELKGSLELNISEIRFEKEKYQNQLLEVKNSVIELVAIKDKLIYRTKEIEKNSSIELGEISEEFDQLKNLIITTKNEVNLLTENQRNDVSLESLTELKGSLELNIDEIKIEKEEYQNQLLEVKNSVVELVAIKDKLIDRTKEIEKIISKFVDVDNFNSSFKISESTNGKIILEIENLKSSIDTITKNIDGLYKFLGEIDKSTIKKLENSTKNSLDLLSVQIKDVKSLLSKYATIEKLEKLEYFTKSQFTQYQTDRDDNVAKLKKNEKKILSLEKKNIILGVVIAFSSFLTLISLGFGTKIFNINQIIHLFRF